MGLNKYTGQTSVIGINGRVLDNMAVDEKTKLLQKLFEAGILSVRFKLWPLVSDIHLGCIFLLLAKRLETKRKKSAELNSESKRTGQEGRRR